jgi:hypothetical protein
MSQNVGPEKDPYAPATVEGVPKCPKISHQKKDTGARPGLTVRNRLRTRDNSGLRRIATLNGIL